MVGRVVVVVATALLLVIVVPFVWYLMLAIATTTVGPDAASAASTPGWLESLTVLGPLVIAAVMAMVVVRTAVWIIRRFLSPQ